MIRRFQFSPCCIRLRGDTPQVMLLTLKPKVVSSARRLLFFGFFAGHPARLAGASAAKPPDLFRWLGSARRRLFPSSFMDSDGRRVTGLSSSLDSFPFETPILVFDSLMAHFFFSFFRSFAAPGRSSSPASRWQFTLSVSTVALFELF